ncbi:hypothetical protein XENTR_v10021084 [Xenopus tropicalis]|nr:hypothetical protein XENTR_v10021084 [Xenopus tropicalis]
MLDEVFTGSGAGLLVENGCDGEEWKVLYKPSEPLFLKRFNIDFVYNTQTYIQKQNKFTVQYSPARR